MKNKLILITFIFLVGCGSKSDVIVSDYEKEELAEVFATESEVTESNNLVALADTTTEQALAYSDEVIETKHVSIAVTGDLMFHSYQLRRSYDYETELFDFDDTFELITPYLEEADLTIGNLETTIGGPYNALVKGDDIIAGYTGYPCFNTPDSVLDSIKGAGFDLLTTANNHSMDSGIDGLRRTLDVLDEKELLHVGTYRTEEESKQHQLVEINGLKFAFISTTYGTNGLTVPDYAEYSIYTLDFYQPDKVDKVCQLVREAKTLNPDYIIVMPHYGNEYKSFQNSYQEDFVNKVFAAGADIVLGSHPHVLQPIDIIEVEREDGTTDEGFVIYSLGNFISSQTASSGEPRDLGVILTLNFKKELLNGEALEAEFIGFSLVPTYTYWNRETIGTLPVDETLEKVTSGEITMKSYDVNRMEYAKEYSINHLMSYLEEYEVEYERYRYNVTLEKRDVK